MVSTVAADARLTLLLAVAPDAALTTLFGPLLGRTVAMPAALATVPAMLLGLMLPLGMQANEARAASADPGMGPASGPRLICTVSSCSSQLHARQLAKQAGMQNIRTGSVEQAHQ
jgi:hypothetical protein